MQENRPIETREFSSLDLRLFGSFEASVNGIPLPRLRTRKGAVLLALLALKGGKFVEREWLAGTLWPDSEPKQALYNLRQSLSDLRRALGPGAVLLHSPTSRTLLLRPQGVSCDVLRFDSLVAQGNTDSWEAALALYTGPLLEPWYEDCLLQERESREESFRRMLTGLAERARTAEDWSEAIRFFRRLITVEPQREGNWQGLMEALAISGDSSGMTETYRRFRLYLHDSLHTSPAAETTTLYQRLLTAAHTAFPSEPAGAGTMTPRAASTVNLPLPRGTLIGREREVAAVVERMQSTRLITLTGAGGIGKTRMALAVATDLADVYPEGVWWVDLASLVQGRQVVGAIAAALRLRENRGEPLLETLLGFLEQKRLLLVMDNCEHLLEDCSAICHAILSRCAGIHLLTTSRQTLRLSEEIVWQVPALSVPDLDKLPAGESERLEAIRSSAAAQLLMERARAVKRDFALTAKNAFPIAQICSRLDGLPLALELAAARVTVLTAEQIVTRLDRSFRLLTRGNAAAPTRQQTLRALVDWSYDLLTGQEKALLIRLSVFAGGWTLEAAEYVCASADATAAVADWEVLDLLTSLVDKSLVLTEAGGTMRYRLLDTLRQYAADKREEEGGEDETVRVRRRHCDWYLARAEEAEPQLQGADQARWLNYLETEHDNLRSALDWLAAEANEESDAAEAGLRLSAALSRFWQVRGYLSEGREQLARALLARRPETHTAAVAATLSAAGSLAIAQGDYVAARALHEEGLRIRRELKDNPGIASSLNNLGNIASAQGDLGAARTLYEETYRLQRESGNRRAIATTLNNLGNVALEQGDYVTARTLHQDSLALCRELGDQRGVASSLNNLGLVAYAQADHATAQSLFEEGLITRRALGDKQGIALSLNNLGNIAFERGDHAAAGSLYEESLVIRRALGDIQGVALSLNNLGNVASARGDFGAAQLFHEESLAVFRESGDKPGVAYALEALAEVRSVTSGAEKAALLWGAAHTLRGSIGVPLPPFEHAEQEKRIVQARSDLGSDIFDAAWSKGTTLTWEQAVDYAFGAVVPSEIGTTDEDTFPTLRNVQDNTRSTPIPE